MAIRFRNKYVKYLCLCLLSIILLSACNGNPLPESGLVNFEAEDGRTVYADLYRTENKKAAYIILFHQGGSSRGEYLEIAPRLNEMGFNCLAVDQRAGHKMNGVYNMTVESGYAGPDQVMPDLRAALLYVKEELRAKKIIVWGSSYSSVLALVLASEFPQDVSAVLAFSPSKSADYFEWEDKKITYYVPNIQCPVFIASSSFRKDQAKSIYDMVPVDDKVYCDISVPGSSALWSNNADSELYWEQVAKFLESFNVRGEALRKN